MKTSLTMAWVAALATASSAAAGCGKGTPEAASGPTGRLQISVHPLALEDVSEVVYRLTVKNAGPAPGDVVWTRDVSSAVYGDGIGAIAYVGTCDADSNPNTIEVALLSMRDAGGALIAPTEYANPAPLDAPIVLTRTCVEEEDVLVRLDLTLVRSADQGFFDIGVTFSDIFCSAKLDCVNALLHDPGFEQRGPTAVLAFACTAGQAADGSTETTWLHFTDVTLSCDGEPPLYFDPALPPGQHGALGTEPAFFETAIYRDTEELPGYDKCFWNMAFGLRSGAGHESCRVHAQATASHVSFGATGSTPPDTLWGYVDWDVPLTDATGAITCGRSPLNGPGSRVVTHYTPTTGAVFAHEWQCGAAAPVTRSLECGGAMAEGGTARFFQSPEGLSVDFAGVRSPTYALPEGTFTNNGAACCMNPCCSAP